MFSSSTRFQVKTMDSSHQLDTGSIANFSQSEFEEIHHGSSSDFPISQPPNNIMPSATDIPTRIEHPRQDHIEEDPYEDEIDHSGLWIKVLLIFCATLFFDVCILSTDLYKKPSVIHIADEEDTSTLAGISWAPLPKESQRLTKIAFGSCSSQKLPMPYWDILVNPTHKPDLLVLMGDNVYGDCNDKNCTALRNAYDAFGQSASFRGAKSILPIVATLDDHDYGQNDCSANNPHKDIARKLFLDFFDIPKADRRWTQKGGVYTSYVWGPVGQRVQVILLDTRFERSAFLPTNEPGAPAKERYMPDYTHTEKQMLSPEQWKWLEKEIQVADVALRLVVSSIQLLAVGTGYECWQMLPHERERMQSLLETSTTTTMILSGDRHVGGFYRDGTLNEITASSWTHTWRLQENEQDEVDEYRLDDFVHDNNYGELEIDWSARRVIINLRRAESIGGGDAYSKSPGEVLQSQIYQLKTT